MKKRKPTLDELLERYGFEDLQSEYVFWWDSFGSGGWCNNDEAIQEAATKMPCRTQGMVYFEDAEWLGLVQTTSIVNRNNRIIIPKCAIFARFVNRKGRWCPA